MLALYIALHVAAAVLFAICEHKDVTASEKGYAEGYVEGNAIVRFLAGGEKPSAIRLHIANLLLYLPFVAIWFLNINSPAAFIPSLGICLVRSASHYRASQVWQKVFETKGAYLTQGKTLWQKFFGW